eukprot:1190692-Prorocentrum_minimum.AAC.1
MFQKEGKAQIQGVRLSSEYRLRKVTIRHYLPDGWIAKQGDNARLSRNCEQACCTSQGERCHHGASRRQPDGSEAPGDPEPHHTTRCVRVYVHYLSVHPCNTCIMYSQPRVFSGQRTLMQWFSMRSSTAAYSEKSTMSFCPSYLYSLVHGKHSEVLWKALKTLNIALRNWLPRTLANGYVDLEE